VAAAKGAPTNVAAAKRGPATKVPATTSRRKPETPAAKPASKPPAAGRANLPASKASKAARPAKPRAPAAKRATAKPAPRKRAVKKRAPRSTVDLHALGARVISVFGPFNTRVLIEMNAEKAQALFPNGGLIAAARTKVIEAVERDVAVLRKASPALADSGLAATAISLAYEIEHPYNSATAKASCAKALMEAIATLRALAPPEERKDELDDIAARRAVRLAAARGAGT
jgi:hypothetical protein